MTCPLNKAVSARVSLDGVTWAYLHPTGSIQGLEIEPIPSGNTEESAIDGYYTIVADAESLFAENPKPYEAQSMATTVEEINGIVTEIADHIGDLYEKDAVLATDIAGLQTQINAIDLTSIIDDAADPSATAVTYSVNKINSLLSAMQTAMVGGASADMDTFGEVETEVTALKGRVTILETKIANLESKFDANGKIKAENLPSFVTGGLVFDGMFNPATDTLPTPAEGEGGNDGHFYTVGANGTVAGTAQGSVTVRAGDTLMSDGVVWVAIAREDVVSSVNGKTGNVVLVGADIAFTATNESGLTATEIQGGLNEVATKMKAFTDAFGDPADIVTVSAFQARLLAARTDGVQTAP